MESSGQGSIRRRLRDQDVTKITGSTISLRRRGYAIKDDFCPLNFFDPVHKRL